MNKSLTKKYSKSADFIIKNDNFLIISHIKPDGDTIAGALALNLFLKEIGKKSTPVCLEAVPKAFDFMRSIINFRQDFLFGDFQAVILVDNGDLKRTGFDQRIKEYARLKKPIINIDHHPQNDIWKIAKINLINEEVSSSSEIIYHLLEKIDPSLINSQIAAALLCGIYTDTGGFKHSTTSSETLAIASRLLSAGAKLKEISESFSDKHPFPTLKLWGTVLKNLRFKEDFQAMISVVTQLDIQSAGANDDDLAGVVNMMNSVPGPEFVLLLYETKDGNIRGSLRSDSTKIDLARIAKLFGGGGHKRASGFLIPGRLVIEGNYFNIV